jgi:hypothetical protein
LHKKKIRSQLEAELYEKIKIEKLEEFRKKFASEFQNQYQLVAEDLRKQLKADVRKNLTELEVTTVKRAFLPVLHKELNGEKKIELRKLIGSILLQKEFTEEALIELKRSIEWRIECVLREPRLQKFREEFAKGLHGELIEAELKNNLDLY